MCVPRFLNLHCHPFYSLVHDPLAFVGSEVHQRPQLFLVRIILWHFLALGYEVTLHHVLVLAVVTHTLKL